LDYEKAASYWKEKDEDTVSMEQAELFAEMKKFILAHNTCALATGSGEFVRCTPIEYSFKDEKFWMLSEGGLKFCALKSNKNVCLAIYDPYVGFANLGGMQITGAAEVIESMSQEYLSLLEFKKIPVESLRKLPHEIHLICITPERIDFLWSGFKKLGYDPRQHLTFPYKD
jgi:hypothetical protein